MAAAAVLLAAPLLAGQVVSDPSVFAEPRTWLLGGRRRRAVRRAVPYALDQVVLTRGRTGPVRAAAGATAGDALRSSGAALLAQRPTLAEVAGIALVMVALVISAGEATAGGSTATRLGSETILPPGHGPDSLRAPKTRICNHAGRPVLPTDEAVDLIALTRDIADKVLDPIVDEHEKAETYPDGRVRRNSARPDC